MTGTLGMDDQSEPDTLPAESVESWEQAVRMGSASQHQAAHANALAVAKARGDLAYQDETGAWRSGSSLPELARHTGMSNEQMRRGTVSLREWGYLVPINPAGPNTPPLYALGVPAAHLWRLAWAQPPARSAPVEHPLTRGQADLIALVGAFIGGTPPATPERTWESNVLVIHGYAGTGKTTTVVRAIREHAPDLSGVLFLAPSNKAAAVLRGEAVPAQTIHSAFYRVTGEDPETGEPIFMENPINEGQAYDLIVVDEASMVDESVARWVESQARRLIVIGDPMQLQPVKGIAYWTAPGRVPDFTLTEVVRTAEAELSRACQQVREGATLASLDRLSVPNGNTIDPTDFDVIVTYTNQERVIVNRMYRGSGPPVPGDRIMLLAGSSKATRDYSGPDDYYNGQILTIDRVIQSTREADGVVPHHEVECTDENGMPRRLLILDRWLSSHAVGVSDGITVERRRIGYRDALPATYAYGITAHKAQGSGWGSVLVVLPPAATRLNGEDARRWGYTALTRAKRQAMIARLDQLETDDAKTLEGDLPLAS